MRCGLLTLRGRYKSLEPLDRGGVDGGVQVVPVSCCLDKERVPQLVCAAAWNYVGPIIAPCSQGGVGCDTVRLLSGSNQSTSFLVLLFCVVVVVVTSSSSAVGMWLLTLLNCATQVDIVVNMCRLLALSSL